MKTCVLALIFFLYSFCSFSQTLIEGTVRDSESKEALPWCSISVKGDKKGAISNSEGTFAISVNVTQDTLLFTYVGYKAMEIPSSGLFKKNVVFLKRTDIQLEELTVHADNGYLYDILDQCRKNMLKEKHYRVAKVYYGIETRTKEQPIEMLECYYNGCMKGSSIDSLVFRNGRTGLAELDQRYFLTLNSSKAISQMDLLHKDPAYPSIPLQYAQKRLKKMFDLTIEPGENSLYHIRFKPWKNIRDHFSGEIWIDRKSFALVKIDLTIDDAARYPFVPMFHIDRLSNVGIRISHTFKNDGSANTIDHINFSYRVNYKSVRENIGTKDPSVIQRVIMTHGVLCFYDYDEPFIIPRFKYDENFDDYRKMSVIPFNPIFWNNNNTLILTAEQKESIGFFADNGLLINFREGNYGKDFLTLTHYDSSLYENCYSIWDPVKRFSLNRNLPQNKVYTQRQINSSILNDKYNLDNLKVQLLLDVTRTGNAFFCKSYTIFDENKSFFHFPDEANTKIFLNIFFDLCEIERRKMEQTLDTRDFTMNQIDSVYHTTLGNMDKITAKYGEEVKMGKNMKALLKWNAVVQENLGIDNVRDAMGDRR